MPDKTMYTRYDDLSWWQRALVRFLPTRDWAVFRMGWGVDPRSTTVTRPYHDLDVTERELVVNPDPHRRRVAAHVGLAPEVLARDPSAMVRMEVAANGSCLDLLAHDPSDLVRERVARQGYALGELMHDGSWLVRKAVADQRFGLRVLLRDPSREVRRAVARQGYGLDVLVRDPDWRVRNVVAMRGYGIDRLASDPDPHVRWTVADRGYGLDRLVADADPRVRRAAEARLEHEGVVPGRWAESHLEPAIGTPGPGFDYRTEREDTTSAVKDRNLSALAPRQGFEGPER